MQHANGLRKLSLPLTLLLLVTSCASVSQSELCQSLSPRVDAHAEALLVDGGDQSVITGEYLIAGFDAGCGG